MSKKDDWKELEFWDESRKETEKEKYGYIQNYSENEQQRKKVDKVVQGMKVTGKTLKFVFFIIVAIIIGIVALLLYINISNMNFRKNIDVIQTMETMYQIEIDTVSKNVDEENNGTYYLQLKNNPEIKFIATKEKSVMKEDFLANCHKYYFEHWNSPNKKYFEIVEEEKNGFLNYETYIEIDNYDDIEPMVKIINEFMNFSSDMYSSCAWKIYLKKDDYTIYPYQHSGMTNEEAIDNAKKEYNRMVGKSL